MDEVQQGWQAAAAPGPVPATAEGEVPPEERTLGLWVHLSALSGVLVPFGNALGPLLVWLLKKDESSFVDHQGKQALNFQFTLMLASLVAGAGLFIGVVLAFVLIGIPIIILGMVALVTLMVLSYVYAVVAGIKANEGVWYRYPFGIEFLK